jgi:hypothetical protein
MEPSAQELLFANIRDHEALSSDSIRNWIDIFLHSIKQASQRAIHGVRNIKSYFQQVTPRARLNNNPNLEVRSLSTTTSWSAPTKDVCRTVRVDCYLQVKELAQRQHVKLDIILQFETIKYFASVICLK